jgi:hypothetical protein
MLVKELNANDRVAMVVQVPKSGTLDWFEWRTGAVSNNPDNGMRQSFQDISATNGHPDGVVDQYRDITGTFSANAWQVPSGTMTDTGADGGTKRTVTKGDWLGCVIDFVSFVALDQIQISTITTPLVHNFAWISDASTGTYAKLANGPVMALRYSDGTYAEFFAPVLPALTFTTNTYGNGSTPDERALRFTVPAACRCAGIWFYGAMASDCDAILYDSSSNVLTSISLDVDRRTDTNTRNHVAYFATPVNLTANTVYRMALKPTTASTITTYDIDVNAGALMACMEGGSSWYSSTRTDAGAWTDTQTSRPTIGILIDAIGS